jgi:hypothetical protein
MTLDPRDAHLADSAGPSVEERINPGPDELVPSEWAEERERSARMLGSVIVFAIAFIAGFVLGAMCGVKP